MTKDRLVIDKTQIPYSFNVMLADVLFKLKVNYNEKADLFTITLYKDDALICCEPIIYGVPLFSDVYMPSTFPAITITPSGESGADDAVTYDNFGKTVFLVIDNTGGEDDG